MEITILCFYILGTLANVGQTHIGPHLSPRNRKDSRGVKSRDLAANCLLEAQESGTLDSDYDEDDVAAEKENICPKDVIMGGSRKPKVSGSGGNKRGVSNDEVIKHNEGILSVLREKNDIMKQLYRGRTHVKEINIRREQASLGMVIELISNDKVLQEVCSYLETDPGQVSGMLRQYLDVPTSHSHPQIVTNPTQLFSSQDVTVTVSVRTVDGRKYIHFTDMMHIDLPPGSQGDLF